MIPLFAIVRVRHARGRFTFWAPLFLLWLLLAPVAVIGAPFLFAGALALRQSPSRLAAGVVGVLFALGGSEVDVDAPGASVLIRLI